VFERLGTWCHDRRWPVLGLWALALAVLGAVSAGLGADYRQDFGGIDTESQRGIDLLTERFDGVGAGLSGSIVFRAEQGVDDPEVRAAMEAYFAEFEGREGLVIESPYEPGNEFQVAFQGDLAGQVAFARLELPDTTDFMSTGDLGADLYESAPEIPGLQVEIGGQTFAEFEEPSSEIIGLAFAIVILILSFGSVLAMGLPVGVALAGIGVGLTALVITSNVLAVPDFSQMMGLMIGLGVGIDYALFIVTRFRENLHRGHTVRESTAIAIDTAGRAVTFAGATVVISFLGMLTMQVGFVSGLAIAAALVVAATVVASLTLLPALLGFAAERVETTRYRGLIAAGLVAVGLFGAGIGIPAVTLPAFVLAVIVLVLGFALAPLKREVPHRAPKPLERTLPYRWSRLIQRRPWPSLLAGAALLVVLAIPVLSLRLAFSDEGNFAEDTTTRKAYDLMADAFGPGFNGPLIVAGEVPEGTDPAVLDAITVALNEAEGVAFASPAQLDDPAAPTAALWQVIPDSAPQDAGTTELVHRLRDTTLPPLAEQLGAPTSVTGFTAAGVDFTSYLSERLVWFFAAVLVLSFLLLMAVFRSLLVPLKAVVMNLLSIGAAYGVAVAIFQWGWLGDLLGVEPAPVEPFVPMMLFAIVFGLSMDYEVFLLSRVKEEWTRTRDSHVSVANGLAATAKVITAAAAIMVVVFGSFLLESDRIIKLFGVGLAVAVLLDATVVRMLLVPATMELLGDRNWWLPRWLDRILPRIDVEGHTEDVDDVTPPGAEPTSELEPV